MSEPDDSRFDAFRNTTIAEERDWIAFLEFEQAIGNAARCAGIINLYDGGDAGGREQSALELVLSQMFFRVLPRIHFGTLVANAEGIGFALRYGLVEPKPEALDSIADTDQFEAGDPRI